MIRAQPLRAAPDASQAVLFAPPVQSITAGYEAGVSALSGASPLAYLETGGYCAPLMPPLASADYECEHGRLPGDRSPACGCWGQR